jgi:hypothetical protein
MPIVTTHYRPKRAPRKKRKQPALASAIVTPAPLKKGPPRHVVRLRDQAPEKANGDGPEQPRRSAVVEPKRASRTFGPAPDLDEEEHRRRGDAADALFREIAPRNRG